MGNGSILARGMQLGTLTALLAFGAGCRQHAPAPPPAPTDQQLANNIEGKIGAESALSGQDIQIGVENGVATLSGTVKNRASRALAGNDAGTIAGVKTVVNNLMVQPPQPTPQPVSPESAAVHQGDHPHSRKRERERKKSRAEEQVAQQTPPPPAPPQRVPEQVRTVPASTPPPSRPVTRTVTLPAGTVLPVRITGPLDSATAQTNQPFHGSLARSLVANGRVAIPQGSSVVGRVVDARDAAHFEGSSLLSLELTQIEAHGRRIPVVTNTFEKEGKGRGKDTAIKSGGGAALGAIIGALAGGGKGAAIGAITGGGIGAGSNGITRGEQVQIQPETVVNFKLKSPITVTISDAQGSPRSNPDNSPQLQQRPQ